MLQTRSVKANLIVTGIKEIAGENCKQKAKAFFRDIMKVAEEVTIKVAHRIGKGSN